MARVVVAPNLLLHAGLSNTLDHRVVMERVGQNEAIGNQAGDRRESRPIRHVTRREASAASLSCRSASSRSRVTRGWLVPAMLRVPPAPVPMRRVVVTKAPTTLGC